MSKKTPTNVNTELHPAWLDTLVPEQYEDQGLFDIILFFVFHSPCVGQSARCIPLSQYGWKEKPWYSPKYLKKPLDDIIFGNKTKVFIASTRKDFCAAISGQDFGENYYNHRDDTRIAVVDTCQNEYMSLFYHIRNSLAHGRIAMYEAHNSDIVFVMEDGAEIKGTNQFEVTARILIPKSTLIKLINFLKNPPPLSDYSEDILTAISQGKCTKHEVMEELNIDETTWDITIHKLKSIGSVRYDKNKWIKVEENR